MASRPRPYFTYLQCNRLLNLLYIHLKRVGQTELHVFDSLKLDDVEQRVMEGNLLVKEVDVAIRAVDRKLEQGLEELRVCAYY